VRRARLDADADREALATLARTADQVRYAPQPPADPAIEGAVTAARELLRRVARLSERRS
jgi:hypothetical protein